MRRTHKNKKHRYHFLQTFIITLTAVMAVGVSGIAVYRLLSPEEKDVPQGEKAEEAFHMFTEEIPSEESSPEEPAEEIPAGRYGEILADEEYMRENNIYAKEAASADEITLAFAGDILFDPAYSVMARMLQRTGGIYDSISPDLLEEMNRADIFMLNNEFPYSDGGTPTPEKQFTFRARPESAGLLTDMGVDLVSLANNHAYDYGESALLDTLSTLSEAGIPYAGAGRNLEEAARPAYFIVNDRKLAFICATQIERLDNPDTKGATETSPGVFRCWNPEKLLEVIKEAKENSDFVVVYIHWGTENTKELDWAQLDQAPKIAEAGADLIIGDHPHCLQKIEYIGDVPVVYSLGNFLFNSRVVDTCLVKATVDENGLKSLQFLPALQKDCAVSLLQGEEKERVLAYMRSISPEVEIDGDGYVTVW